MCNNPVRALLFPRPALLPALLLVPLLALLATSVLAMPSDREQPIQIESDTAVRDDRAGTTVYEGDVVIEQGTMLINADKVTVYTVDRRIDRIVAVGDPAHYEQMPSAEEDLVTARAKTLEYRLSEELIVLTTNASLEQAGSTLTGERIDYDLQQEVVKARGDGDRQRTRMVIPPSQLKDSE